VLIGDVNKMYPSAILWRALMRDHGKRMAARMRRTSRRVNRHITVQKSTQFVTVLYGIWLKTHMFNCARARAAAASASDGTVGACRIALAWRLAWDEIGLDERTVEFLMARCCSCSLTV
jgi:hypothetical protein